MLVTMVKFSWLHYRGGGVLGLNPHAGWTQENSEKELTVVANLGWQERQILFLLE